MYNVIEILLKKGKINMRKLLYSIKNVPLYEDSDDGFSLEYSVVDTNEPDVLTGYTEQFGIEVARYQEFDGILYSETKTLENISVCKQSAMRLVKLISENSVTPFILEEVINELKGDELHRDIFNT